MKKLKLNFLDNPIQIDQLNLIKILEDFGREICEYGKEYFSFIITTASDNGVLTDFTLYILAPEIGYEYRVINVEIKSVTELKINFYTLITKQTDYFIVNISEGTAAYESKLSEILSNNLFNASLRFLVDQVHQKRYYRDGVRGKIVVGQARTATLSTGERIKVGFQRIEGDDVIYYTGKGLSEMFKPSMTEEERKEAERLKSLSEDQLIKDKYMERKKISDFEDIE